MKQYFILLFLVVAHSLSTHQQRVEEDLSTTRKDLATARAVALKVAALQGGGGAPAYTLADVAARTNYDLEERFSAYRCFAPTFDKTDTLSSNSTQAKKKRANIARCHTEQCVVCGEPYEVGGPENSNPKVSVAHILKNAKFCKGVGVNFYDTGDCSNFLLLCGVESKEDSCHGQFDKFRMSFRHVRSNQDMTKWLVIGGGWRHGILVTLKSKPHRRVMHAHLFRALRERTLNIPEEIKQAPSNVLARVTYIGDEQLPDIHTNDFKTDLSDSQDRTIAADDVYLGNASDTEEE